MLKRMARSTQQLSLRLPNRRLAVLDRAYMARYFSRTVPRWYPGTRLQRLTIIDHSAYLYKKSVEFVLRVVEGGTGRTDERRLRANIPSLDTTFEAENAFRAMTALAQHRTGKTLAMSRPLVFDRKLRMLLYEAVPGTPLMRLLRHSPMPRAPLRAAAQWLARLHGARIPFGRRRAVRHEHAEAGYFAMNYRRFYPKGLAAAESLLAAFFSFRQPLAGSIRNAATLIHGDFNANNIIVQPGGDVAVIDFGNAWSYDPMSDLANAVVQFGYAGHVSHSTQRRVQRAFFRAYAAAAPLSQEERRRYHLFLLWWALQTLAFTATLPLTNARNFRPVVQRTLLTARTALRGLTS